MAKTEKSQEIITFKDIFKDKSTLSIIIATVVLLLFSFLAFRYFGSANVNEGVLNGEGISDISLDIEKNDSKTDSEIKKDEVKKAEDSKIEKSKVETKNAKWVANDYEKNEFEKNSKKYTVQKGDTLWEIAEAYYGNGADWHKIADANNVGNLSNGNPLISIGQVLTIP
ncbi:LysM peptidoglycan-binding domain-containing protein [Patescibacteria group bacterium]|nr:LysM peptidoglycan-binding domain-containing protein [Patescibacteria group bacterium]